MENKTYLLTNNDLRMYDPNNPHQFVKVFEKPKKSEKGEEVLFAAKVLNDFSLKKQKMGIFSYFDNKKGEAIEVCVREFMDGKMVDRQPVCIHMKGEKVINIIVKADEALIVMTKETYVLNSNFELMNIIEGQAHGGDGKFISLGEKIYDLEKEAIY